MPEYVLRRSIGPWSAGTGIKIIFAEKDSPVVVVQVLGRIGQEFRFECNLNDIVKQRTRKKAAAKLNRQQRRNEDVEVLKRRSRHEDE